MNRKDGIYSRMWLWMVVVLLVAGCVQEGYSSEKAAASSGKNLSGKKVLFVVFDRFDQSEYTLPRNILRARGAAVTVPSSSLRALGGYQGSMRIKPDILLKNANMSGYDALVFIGGYRYETNNPDTHRLVREALAQHKPVAAICIAPVTLAKASVIKGRRVTASTRHAVLRSAGGIVQSSSVVRDGLIITGNGPSSAARFGRTIAAALAE